MRILTVRAPWWWWLFHGKDIENREWAWAPQYRGTVLIHASKQTSYRAVVRDSADALNMAGAAGLSTKGPTIEHLQAYAGHIVGSVELVDCVTKSDSPWFVGPLGLVLAKPRLFPQTIQFKSHLGLFTPPQEIVDAVRAITSKATS